MSLPYFNLYPTDFEADTSHLSLAEDGAYNRLLRLIWMSPTCDLPDDDRWIMRRMRVSKEEFESVVLIVIEEFFDRSNGRLSNARMSKEFERSNEAHKKRVIAGKKGGKSKSLKNNDLDTSNAKAKPKQPEPEPEPDITTPQLGGRNLEKLEIDLRKAAGLCDAISPNLFILSEPIRWLEAGCDMALDIIPTLKAKSHPRVSTWSYFNNAVFETRDKRIAPAPDVVTNISRPIKQKSVSDLALERMQNG